MILPDGKILSDRYEIIEKIGAGGMAIVYRAKDIKLERFVTVKVLREEFITDEEFRSRFKVEARSAASLSHQNIVNVYDVGNDGEIYYIVMEYIDGETLKKVIVDKAPFDTITTISVAIQIAAALSNAHKNHIIHRDIKPQNILLAKDGTIKVTDFGIARAATSATVTVTANALGSVHYFSPEQARGGYVDERSDIYSLGITMFEMVTGIVPYDGDTSVAIALKHLSEELPDMRQYNPGISKSLEGIIKKATRKKADERYASINYLLSDLKKALSDSTGSFITKEEPEAHAYPLQKQDTGEMERIEREAQQEIKMEILENMPRRAKKVNRSSLEELPGSAAFEPSQEMEASPPRQGAKPPYDGVSAEEGVRPSKKMTERLEETPLPEPGVGFEKYRKKLHITKEEEFGEYDEYEEEPVSRKSGYRRDYDDYDEKSQERRVVIAAIVTALVIIVIITVVGIKVIGKGREANQTTPDTTGQNGQAITNKDQAPDFKGLTMAQAQARAAEAGIAVEQSGEEYSRDYEEGTIISQNLDPGASLKDVTKVMVVVSKGLESVDMISVVTLEENEAKRRLQDITSAQIVVEYANDNEAEIGTVISQHPAEGSRINKDDTITLTVSKGEELKTIKMEKLEGMTEEQALARLKELELTPGNITRTKSSRAAKGIVITQTVPAGDDVVKNSVIGLVISDGPEIEEPPETPAENPTEETPIGAGETETPTENETPAETPVDLVIPINLPVLQEEMDSVQVKVLQIGAGGASTVIIDETRSVLDFPFNILVSGTGQAELQLYINGNLQSSEKIDFSKGANR